MKANSFEPKLNFKNDQSGKKMNIQFPQNGKWNGLMASLVEKKYDLVLTALKVREGLMGFLKPLLRTHPQLRIFKRNCL